MHNLSTPSMEHSAQLKVENSAALHVVMFPYLAFGHIAPFLQLARKLSAAAPAGIRITFLSAAANVPRIASLLPSSPSISVLSLHLPAVPGLPPGTESTANLTPAAAELLKLAVDGTKPQVESVLRDLRPDFVIFDFGMQWLPTVAAPLGVKTLFFSVFAAVSTAYLTVPARRVRGVGAAIDDLKRPPAGFPSASSIKSVPEYQAADFSYIFKSFDGPCVYERVVECMERCTAILAKTCMQFEGQYVNYVQSQYQKPMLLIGPVAPEPPVGELETRWADWLDRFAEGSVVFCSFGSETFLSDEGARELLLGLEMTGMPFLAVLNSPEGEGRQLPEGFDERVRGRGLVHGGWVQQQHILRHRSVGCFVCHAGLSSVVEGLVAGCRLVMLPQKGDQYLNAALFSRDLGVGAEVEGRRAEDGGFNKEAVCAAVRKVMAAAAAAATRERHVKVREFLQDEKVQEGFMAELMNKLKELLAAA